MNEKSMVFVVIPTRNRPQKVACCLNNLLSISYENFEIVIADQSDNGETKAEVNKFHSSKIRYYKIRTRGRSKGLNFAIKKVPSNGDMVAFTDDDCIVTKDWLTELVYSKGWQDGAGAVTGKVLPYMPRLHKGKYCPSTVMAPDYKLFDKPVLHCSGVGSGNNICFKKGVLMENGGFLEWLSRGSIGMSTEDGEMIFRTLSRGIKIVYEPKAVIYHDNWLNKWEMDRVAFTDDCGIVAAYGYHWLKGNKAAGGCIATYYKGKAWDRKEELVMAWKTKHLKFILRRIIGLPVSGVYFIRGFSVALYYYFRSRNS